MSLLQKTIDKIVSDRADEKILSNAVHGLKLRVEEIMRTNGVGLIEFDYLGTKYKYDLNRHQLSLQPCGLNLLSLNLQHSVLTHLLKD